MTVISAMKNSPARIRQLASRAFFALIFSLLLFFSGISLVQAAAGDPCPPGQTVTEVGCLPKDPIQFISSFYGIGLGLIGGVALIFIIVGGYTILTSRGNPQQVNVGKSYIFYAVVGLLMAIFGYVFAEVFLVDILNLPGFGH